MASLRIALSVCILATCSALAQSAPAAAPLAFDVASVRPSKADEAQHTNVPLDSGNVYGSVSPDDARSAAGGYFSVTHQALWRYIVFAYKLSGTQEMGLRFSYFAGVPKSGGPLWATGSFDASPEFFDISARAPAGTSIYQMRLMMQTLLADRFHLALHFVTADAPVFALVLVKPGATGPNLQPHPASDSCAALVTSKQAMPNQAERDQPAPRPSTSSSVVGELPPACGVIAHVPSSAPGMHFGGRAVPLPLFATSVPTMTGLAAMPRPVVDRTGLSGLYDFTLNWIHDPSGEDATSDNIASFHNALKNQLGLELKSSHAPLSFVFIDHVEKPSAN